MIFALFSRRFAALPIPELGKVAKREGFDGIELAVRPDGHVVPGNVATELPRAVAALREAGLSVPVISTDLTSGREPHAAAVLDAAAAQGIREVRLGYWPYEPFGRIHAQVSAARAGIEKLETLAAESGVRVSVGTHSGHFLTAAAATVFHLIEGRDPKRVGAYVDLGHMTVEGADSAWLQGLDLLQEYITVVAAKAFAPFSETDPSNRATTWRYKTVPLPMGIVRWHEAFDALKQLAWDGIVSFHSWYRGAISSQELTLSELGRQSGEDLRYVRGILGEST